MERERAASRNPHAGPGAHRSFRPAPGIEALRWGAEDGPVAILVHGFPDTAWTWRSLGPHLAARGWTVIAPFNRGYAPSDLAPDDSYEIGELVRDVLAVRESIPEGRRVALVGHDWGGAIVSAVAATAPDRFDRAVLLAIPPLATILNNFRRPNLRLLRQLPRSWYMSFFQIPMLPELLGAPLFDLFWRLWSNPGYDSAADRARLAAALPDRARRRAALSYYRAVLNPCYQRRQQKGARSRWFGAMRVPTLYLHGADDRCGRADIGADALADLPGGSERAVVEGAGHFLHLDSPEQVNRLVAEWIETPAGGAGRRGEPHADRQQTTT